MRISEKVYEQTQTPGYYLTTKGIIDYNLKYVGYGYGQEIKAYDIKIYSCDFTNDTWKGKKFTCYCNTTNEYVFSIVLRYARKIVNDDIKDHLDNFTYKNHDTCFLKIPNNIK